MEISEFLYPYHIFYVIYATLLESIVSCEESECC